MNDQEFIEQVKKEMKEYETHAVNSDGDKFAVWFANKFLALDIGEIVNKFHIGKSGDEKTDLGIIDDRFPTKMIIQCKYSANPIDKAYGKDEVDETLSARRRIETAPNDGNDLRRQFVQDFKGSKLPEKLIIVGFGRFTNLEHNNAYEYAIKSSVQIYDFERLKREYLRITDPTSAQRPEAIELPKTENMVFPFVKDKTKAYFAVIPTIEMYKIVKEKGDGAFEENLRYQLPKASVSSMISEEIKGTLEKEPLEFVILNNGVTFICERAELCAKTINLIKPQIINGCQTAYAIFEIYDSWIKGKKNIEDVISYIPIKIIETDITDARRLNKISRAANLQNPITARNRFSNDEIQTELRGRFAQFSPPIFYDHKDGSWESIIRRNQQSIFKVPNVRGKVYRILNNQIIGQIYLSLLGKPQVAGNQKGIIFSEEKYYNTVFNYKLSASDRFANIGISKSDALIGSGEDNFINDVLFGFCVYRLLDAIELVLYPKKKSSYKDDPDDPDYQYYTKIATKEFVSYWHFHIIRMLQEIIHTKASGDQAQISIIKKNLLGNNVDNNIDLFFSPTKTIANEFNLESNRQKYTILNIANPSKKFPLFGKWISNLEQVVYDVVSPEREKPDWKGFNQFFYKRETTLIDIRKKVTDILGGADSDLKFPISMT